MIQLPKFATARVVEKSVGLRENSIDAIAWLVMQEAARGVAYESIAKGLDSTLKDLDALADMVTGETGGVQGDSWRSCIVILKSVVIANGQTLAKGWDSIEAMAVNRLASKMADAENDITTKDALAIAQIANKANRRDRGEGGPARTAVSIHAQNGEGGGDMSVTLQGGNLGSIRLSLSARVQAQLQTPKTIDGKASAREMLSLEDTRNLRVQSDN